MAKDDINIESAFHMEPKEIVKYFESKGCKISFDWHEVYEDAHAKAFTVAKMTQADLLKDTQDMLTQAIKEGWTEKKFEKNAAELFTKKGWVGHKEMTNPKTGETKTVELGTPRRIKTIFQSNMHSAYSVGRYKQQLEDADIAPYWMYQCIMDGKTRPEHKAMHGKVFRYDDAFWNNFYPPNGWGCRCFVKSLTENQLNQRGLKCESSKGKIRDVTDIVGGEERGNKAFDFNIGGKSFTLKPDAGWGSNNAIKAWGLDVQAYKKIAKLPQEIQDRFISDMAQNVHNKKVLENFVNNYIKNDKKNEDTIKEKTLTWITPTLLKRLKADDINLHTPIIVLTDDRIGHTLDKKVDYDELIGIYDILNNPDGVYYDYTSKNGTGLAYTKNIDNKKCIKVCVKLNYKLKKGKKINVTNWISTVGKVLRVNMETGKDFKKIE